MTVAIGCVLGALAALSGYFLPGWWVLPYLFGWASFAIPFWLEERRYA